MRKLRIDEIDFRVGMANKNSKGAYCTLLAYKDARVDMSVLDEVYKDRWQNEYKRDSKGVLQCGIGVHQEGIGWIWKWSNGTESNTEAAKGEYSDAFKRAGFMVGIGRELYDMPNLFVKLLPNDFTEQNGKVKINGWFKPNDWNWEMTDQMIRATDNDGTQRVYAKFGKQTSEPVSQAMTPLAKPIAAKPKEKEVIVFGTPKFDSCVKWIQGEGTIEKAKALYSISEEVEEAIKKVLMVKSEL